jgi:hypothetical protein
VTIREAHYQAIIGLPAAAAVSFIIVIFLLQTEGPIEFEGLGFKLKGAAGQATMWVILLGYSRGYQAGLVTNGPGLSC